jgi:hypothetical protein
LAPELYLLKHQLLRRHPPLLYPPLVHSLISFFLSSFQSVAKRHSQHYQSLPLPRPRLQSVESAEVLMVYVDDVVPLAWVAPVLVDFAIASLEETL